MLKIKWMTIKMKPPVNAFTVNEISQYFSMIQIIKLCACLIVFWRHFYCSSKLISNAKNSIWHFWDWIPGRLDFVHVKILKPSMHIVQQHISCKTRKYIVYSAKCTLSCMLTARKYLPTNLFKNLVILCLVSFFL